jgi:hypothetical protein
MSLQVTSYLRCGLISATLLAGAASVGARDASTIYPTGHFPLDAQNIQAAVDQGGKVILKAVNLSGKPTAFNFGTPDPNHGGTTCFVPGVSVELTTNVEIVGETFDRHMTTIKGGCNPIFGDKPVIAKIEGIDFESPVAAAIIIVNTKGIDIVGNRIRGVIGVLLGFGFTDGDGIDLFGNDDPLHAITGHVLIANNTIENLRADFANGMQLDEVSASFDIRGNTVTFPRSHGNIQTIGITAFRCHNRVSITGNNVYMGPGNPNSYPAAILAGGHHEARYTIASNDVVVNNSNGDAIEVTGGDFSEPTYQAKVIGNRIRIFSTAHEQSGPSYFGGAGVDVYGAVNDSLISANEIKGFSAFALEVGEGFESTSVSESDLLLSNKISGHKSLVTDVYFGTNTSQMRFAGYCGSDIDLGAHNHIACSNATDVSSAQLGRTAFSPRALIARRESAHSAMLDWLRYRPSR